MNSTDFRSLKLSPSISRALQEMKFLEMTAIQVVTIPAILEGKDVVGHSKTGSGKTGAFIIPLLQKINIRDASPQALILCPTRELCEQVFKESKKLSKYIPGFSAVCLSGGQPSAPQIDALKKGAQLLIGTPGRTLEYLKNGFIRTPSLKILVLDEADRLLQDGFAEELQAILNFLPIKRQTIFFSATFPPGIEELSRKHQRDAEHLRIANNEQNMLQIDQYLYMAEKPQKTEALLQILKNHPSPCTLIFCRTKAAVSAIGELLLEKGFSSLILHADLKQVDRDRATNLFRNGKIQILVATDVAARGLDIDRLELVINVDLPSNSDIYVHRIGRTGRAGRKGTAVSIGTEYETDLIADIEAFTGVTMSRMSLPTRP